MNKIGLVEAKYLIFLCTNTKRNTHLCKINTFSNYIKAKKTIYTYIHRTIEKYGP